MNDQVRDGNALGFLIRHTPQFVNKAKNGEGCPRLRPARELNCLMNSVPVRFRDGRGQATGGLACAMRKPRPLCCRGM
jgi:hypothetical protein